MAMLLHKVRLKLLNEWAQVPQYAKPGDVGMDLRWAEERVEYMLEVGETHVFWTGIAIELGAQIEGQVRPRSGLSSKGIACAFGTVDSSYRGNIGVTLTNLSGTQLKVSRGDRVAQIVLSRKPTFAFEVADELSSTERGSDGHGSTGIR